MEKTNNYHKYSVVRENNKKLMHIAYKQLVFFANIMYNDLTKNCR